MNDNTASLTSDLPYFVEGADPLDMNANGGGIHAGDGSTVTIDRTTFGGNAATVTDPNGEPVAFAGALHPGDGRFVLRHSTISDNRVVALVASTADAGPSGSAIDVAGEATIVDTRIVGNTTLVTSRSGAAGATGGGVYAFGAGLQPVMIRDSVISDNTTIASSAGGSGYVFGAGLLNDGRLVLSNDVIANNSGIARGPTGSAQGGGIWNGSIFNQPPIELTLDGTSVTGNRLRGTSGITIQGGGLFTNFPVTLRHSKIAGNSPDDCFGCSAPDSITPHGSASLGRANGTQLVSRILEPRADQPMVPADQRGLSPRSPLPVRGQRRGRDRRLRAAASAQGNVGVRRGGQRGRCLRARAVAVDCR